MSVCDKIKQLISDGWKLIDVREPHEFANGHVEGASNVRLPEVVGLTPDDKYLLYCRSGARSGSAQQYLQAQGIEAVNIGGINQFIGCIRN